jgi:hypothetical protein
MPTEPGPTIRVPSLANVTIGAASGQVVISKAAIEPAIPAETIGLCIRPRQCQVHELTSGENTPSLRATVARAVAAGPRRLRSN